MTKNTGFFILALIIGNMLGWMATSAITLSVKAIAIATACSEGV